MTNNLAAEASVKVRHVRAGRGKGVFAEAFSLASGGGKWLEVGAPFSGTVCIGRPPRYEHVFFRKNVSLRLYRGGMRGKAAGSLSA